MPYKQQIKKTVKLLLTIASLVAVVAVIRYFLIESYRISTPSMANTLKEGDFILVNKLKNHPERNRVILFNSPLLKDSVSSPLFLSRCIGLPGDTIRVSDEGYTINSRFFPLSPNAVCLYKVENFASDLFLNTLERLKIPARNKQDAGKHILVSLTPFEEYSIREELPEDINRVFVRESTGSYSLIVPRKGRPYRLDTASLIACREAILREADLPVAFRGNKLYMDGKETDFFFFGQDYYWVLSDNMNGGIDSRHLGFIPADHILGTAWYCWFSPSAERLFKTVN